MREARGAPATTAFADCTSPSCDAGLYGVGLVLLIAVTVRVLALASLPLVITNDGVEYVSSAWQLVQEGTLSLREVRTPAYPLFLAGVFEGLGVSAVAVKIAQHALGCAACVLLAITGCRLAGPRFGWIPGVLLALDPWLLMFECYALTEPLAVFLVILAVFIAIRWTRQRGLAALMLGFVLAAACLTRPALQAVVPFLALAWLLNARRSWPARGLAVAGLAIGFGAAMLPWLHYNQQRGVPQVARGLAAAQWVSLAHYNLVDWSYPIPEEVRSAYERRFAGREGRPGGYELLAFLEEVGAFQERADLFRKWSEASVLNNFGAYVRIWPQALGWQLNFPNGYGSYDQLNWYLARLARAGSGFQFDGDAEEPPLPYLDSAANRGPMRSWIAWLSEHRLRGVPQIPLFVLALLTIVVGGLRRQWTVALVMGGTVVFLLVHVGLLKSPARYAVPAWTVWYLAVAALPALLFARAVDRAPAGPPAPGAPPREAHGKPAARFGSELYRTPAPD